MEPGDTFRLKSGARRTIISRFCGHSKQYTVISDDFHITGNWFDSMEKLVDYYNHLIKYSKS